MGAELARQIPDRMTAVIQQLLEKAADDPGFSRGDRLVRLDVENCAVPERKNPGQHERDNRSRNRGDLHPDVIRDDSHRQCPQSA